MSSRREYFNNVMLVDDEPDILESVTEGLKWFGIKVDGFSAPTKALSQFKPHVYDVVILDIKMPELSGFQLARKIWEQEQNARICFFSAFEEYQNEALKTFFGKNYCFIKKPISIEKLASHIHTHIFTEPIPSR